LGFQPFFSIYLEIHEILKAPHEKLFLGFLDFKQKDSLWFHGNRRTPPGEQTRNQRKERWEDRINNSNQNTKKQHI
jgi:hypothetical protein